MTANSKQAQRLKQLLDRWVSDGHCRAVAAECGTTDSRAFSFAGGQLAADNATEVDLDSIFLIASPTKPIVVTAAMMLVEQGLIQIDHKVSRYIPGFAKGSKSEIRIIHLMTHTSGLPDMLPNNETLRKEHRPLDDFMSGVEQLEIENAPGTKIHYQSMGILTLASIMEQVSGQRLPVLLEEKIFAPLSMSHTSLGIPDSWKSTGQLEAMTSSQVDDQPHANDWGWNSEYWRTLAAPWGGLLASAADLGRFCRHLLGIHEGDDGILSRATLQAMTTNRLNVFRDLPRSSVESRPWGLGWQLNWPGHPRGFGSVLSPEAYGHWGATGTLVWLDPDQLAYGVVLTTEPISMENRRQIQFANLSAAMF